MADMLRQFRSVAGELIRSSGLVRESEVPARTLETTLNCGFRAGTCLARIPLA